MPQGAASYGNGSNSSFVLRCEYPLMFVDYVTNYGEPSPERSF
jgi:hypothetical protein